MDFLRFCFPFFCTHWLMGNNLLSADPTRYANHLWTDTMGIQPIAEMGILVG